MKLINKISLVLIAFSILLPNIYCQNAVGDIKIENSLLEGVIPGSYVIWNITEANNAYIHDPPYYDPSHNTIMVGHQIKLTITGTTFMRELVAIPIEYGYFYTYQLTDNPCLIGKLEYHNTSSDEWQQLHSSTAIAFLMYNKSSGALYSAADIVEKYFLSILPSNINLTKYGNDIVDIYYKWQNNPFNNLYTELDITSFSSTTDALNLTLEQKANPYDIGYNYIKTRSDGIISNWDYNFMGSQITAEYLTQWIPEIGPSIPFGNEFIFLIGICVISLVIIVRKRIHIEN